MFVGRPPHTRVDSLCERRVKALRASSAPLRPLQGDTPEAFHQVVITQVLAGLCYAVSAKYRSVAPGVFQRRVVCGIRDPYKGKYARPRQHRADWSLATDPAATSGHG